ncbi:MAG: phosphodiester glycosidase family protein [Miltoncostaeaceae bacterium]
MLSFAVVTRRHSVLTLAALVAAATAAGTAGTGPAGAAVSALPTGPTPRVTTIAPGITHERLVLRGGQVLHLMRGRPTGRVGLSAAQPGGGPSRRGPLTGAHADRADVAGAVAGVNGDFFNFTSGNPSGVLLIGSELISEPEASRSALLIRSDGLLDAARLALRGRYRGADPRGVRRFSERTFQGINRPAQRDSEAILYTTAYGRVTTPTGEGIREVRVRLDQDVPLQPGVPISGAVVGTGRGGTTIGRGHVVLTGVGAGGAVLARDLQPGLRVTITPGLVDAVDGLPTPAELVSAVGGGPLLVRDGVAVTDAGEGLSSAQTGQRTARTAVGQNAAGFLLLVVAEGPAQGSPGVTAAEQAELMERLGARVAVAMDAGGSAQAAIGGRHLVDWGSSPRSLANALLLTYRGLMVDEIPRRLSPNGDGVDDSATTAVRSPLAGPVSVTLERRSGSPRRTLWRGTLDGSSATIGIDPRSRRLPDGIYTLTARQIPGDGSGEQVQTRRFIIDRTLASLGTRASTRRQRQRLAVGFTLLRPARVTVVVRDGDGRPAAVLARGRAQRAGRTILGWNRRIAGRPAEGTYSVEVIAVSPLGRSGLVREVRLAPPPARRGP